MSPANSRKLATPERRGLNPCKRRKRRRSAGASCSTAVDESESPPWASLDEDLLGLIAGRVLASDITDYLHFREVCPQWRSSAACPRGRSVVDPRFHPRHWMMLPEGYRLYPGHTKLGGSVRFFNLRTGALATVRLPIFRDHFALDSVDGLLLLQRDHDMAVRLLHPFTGDIVELPSLATLMPQLTALFNPAELPLKKIIFLQFARHVCAAISYSPNDGVVTAMLALTALNAPRVAFATSEDQQWTISSWEVQRILHTLSLQGKLYFLTNRLQFLMVDPPQRRHVQGSPSCSLSLQPPKLIATGGRIHPPVHLAECDSEILLVGRTVASKEHVLVYKLADLMLGRFAPVRSIGGNSLLVGKRSICVSSKAHPTIGADSVVCLHPPSKDLGQYCLRSGTWSTATDGDFLRGPIPSPYTLIHHIYTCCERYYWNKGQLFCPAIHPKWGAKTRWRAGG